MSKDISTQGTVLADGTLKEHQDYPFTHLGKRVDKLQDLTVIPHLGKVKPFQKLHLQHSTTEVYPPSFGDKREIVVNM